MKEDIVRLDSGNGVGDYIIYWDGLEFYWDGFVDDLEV